MDAEENTLTDLDALEKGADQIQKTAAIRRRSRHCAENGGEPQRQLAFSQNKRTEYLYQQRKTCKSRISVLLSVLHDSQSLSWEPPYTERYVRWCGRTEVLSKTSSYPIYSLLKL